MYVGCWRTDALELCIDAKLIGGSTTMIFVTEPKNIALFFLEYKKTLFRFSTRNIMCPQEIHTRVEYNTIIWLVVKTLNASKPSPHPPI